MAEPYSLADYLQGRRPNALMDAGWATPNALAGYGTPEAPPPRSYGKGSVQSIPQEPLGQANALSRFAGSFGQPSLDLTRQITEEGQRTGRLPEWSFSDAVGMMGTMPMGPFGSVRVPNPIRAYHGSPHRFDQFDLRRMGSGEGNQDMGRGVYLSTLEPEANWYRFPNMQQGFMVGDHRITRPSDRIGRYAYDELLATHGDVQSAIDRISRSDFNIERRDAALRQLNEWRQHGARAGHMYETDLHIHPEELMSTRDRLRGMAPRNEEDAARLAEQGVHGLTYPAQWGGGTNYVTWSPERIEILRRYGIAAPVAGGAAATTLMGDQPQY